MLPRNPVALIVTTCLGAQHPLQAQIMRRPNSRWVLQVTGMQRLVWDISDDFLPMNATTFYYPAVPGRRSRHIMLHHHGHAHGCDAAGCTWWDFYNVSTWIHKTLGMVAGALESPCTVIES